MRLLKTIHRGWKAYDFNPFSQMASRWWWLREEVCPYKSLFRRQVCHHPGDSCRSLCAEWLVHTEIYGPNSLHFTQTLMFHLAILCSQSPAPWRGGGLERRSRQGVFSVVREANHGFSLAMATTASITSRRHFLWTSIWLLHIIRISDTHAPGKWCVLAFSWHSAKTMEENIWLS